jgi:hypothetical protein
MLRKRKYIDKLRSRSRCYTGTNMQHIRGNSLAAGMVLGVALLAATPANAALVGYYNFDDPSNLGADSSGNGNNLTVYSSSDVGYSASGVEGGAVTFDGNGYLSTTSGSTPASFPTGNSDYTISVSFKTTATQALSGIPLTLLGWGDYSAGGPNDSNALRLLLPGAEGGQGVNNYWWYSDLQGHATVDDGLWHTIVASYDGTTRSIYLDGTLLGTDTPGVNDATSNNFAIGLADPLSTTNASFIGSIDNVAIFTSALTPTGVADTIPEPASLAVLSIGTLGLGAAKRRKRA